MTQEIRTIENMGRKPQTGDVIIQSSYTRNKIPEMLRECILKANARNEGLEFIGYRCEIVPNCDGHNWNLYAYFAPQVPKASLDPRNMGGATDIALWQDCLSREDMVAKGVGLKDRRF